MRRDPGFSHRLEKQLIVALIHDSHACVDGLGRSAEFPMALAVFVHQSDFSGHSGMHFLLRELEPATGGLGFAGRPESECVRRAETSTGTVTFSTE